MSSTLEQYTWPSSVPGIHCCGSRTVWTRVKYCCRASGAVFSYCGTINTRFCSLSKSLRRASSSDYSFLYLQLLWGALILSQRPGFSSRPISIWLTSLCHTALAFSSFPLLCWPSVWQFGWIAGSPSSSRPLLPLCSCLTFSAQFQHVSEFSLPSSSLCSCDEHFWRDSVRWCRFTANPRSSTVAEPQCCSPLSSDTYFLRHFYLYF